MHVIHAQNVNHALPMGVFWFNNNDRHTIKRTARGLATVEADGPMVTVYYNPMQRVLFSPLRDANPFFHLFESMWILAGREDVGFLSYFLNSIANYSDDGIRFHGAYGRRLGLQRVENQLFTAAGLLSADPSSRRAVLSIWDATLDCGADTRDLPCNDLVAFLIRDGKLDMTVYNRSNDMVWGAYGANAVQFAFIQEAMASLLRVPAGRYYQVSNSFHVYLNDQWDKIKGLTMAEMIDPYDPTYAEDPDTTYVEWMPMGDFRPLADDLRTWFKAWDVDAGPHKRVYETYWAGQVMVPAFEAFMAYKVAVTRRREGDGAGFRIWTDAAFNAAAGVCAVDWGQAMTEWLGRRLGVKV